MRFPHRVALLVLALVCTACQDRRLHEFDGRWAVRLHLDTTWYRNVKPLANDTRGELAFSPRMPGIPWWESSDWDDVEPLDFGCSFLQTEPFDGMPVRPEWSSPEAARHCTWTIAYRRSVTVHIVSNVGFIDAETSLTGFRRGDTIRGTWMAGAEGLDQGGKGTFVMWKLRGPPSPHFYVLERAERRTRRTMNIVAALDWFFDLGGTRSTPPPGVLACAAVLALAAGRLARGGWRRRATSMTIILAAAAVEWHIYQRGGPTLQAAFDFTRAYTVHWPPVLLLLAAMLLIPAVAVYLLLRLRRQ